MNDLNKNPITANMVNYTNVLTSIPNEVYVSSTETPDSLAFLIKNKIIIDFSLLPIADENGPSKINEGTTDASYKM
jgi:hypothetical protein